ncbi:hypothetical protein V8C42DRAFT_137331 [Trichoderma barbatum]
MKRRQFRPRDNQGPIILGEVPCKDCGEVRLPGDTASDVCHPCRQRASRLEAPGKNEITTHCQSRIYNEELVNSGDSGDELAKSSDAVANKRKRDQDDEDNNHLKPYKRQKYTDESEQSDCDEGCGKPKQGRSTRCADCARKWRNKKSREWYQKKRDEARMAKTCEEENCPRPPEGSSKRY